MSKGKRQPLTPEERKARVEALNGDLKAGIAALVNDENWSHFLQTARGFGTTWSFNNLVLIAKQAAERGFNPTMVKTFDAWKQMGRRVKKGEKALYIFEPVKYRLTMEEARSLGAAGFGKDGKPRMQVRGMKIGPRFDISQTEGEPVPINPAVPALITGEDITGAWDAVAAQIQAAGYTVERGPMTAKNGSSDPVRHVVCVADFLDDAHATKTLIHELAHILLGHVDDIAEYRQHRGRMEAEAESVAYIVAGAFGMDTAGYSVPYVAGWCKGDLDVLAEVAQRVTTTAQQIITAVQESSESAALESAA